MADFGKLILSKPDGLSQEFLLNKTLVTLGRATTNDIVLVEGRVSRNHAQVQCADDGITLTDLNSANGVWLNGQRIVETKIQPGNNFQDYISSEKSYDAYRNQPIEADAFSSGDAAEEYLYEN